MARHSPSSTDFSPSVGIGVAPGGVDTVFLNWAAVDAAQGLPASPAVAMLLYNGGSLPALQAADQILVTGGSTSTDVGFASWSSVSVDPSVISGTCAVTAQQYWVSGGTKLWFSRLARICGPAQVTVPDVRGNTVAAARAALTGAFLSAGAQNETQNCSPAQNGLVVGAAPAIAPLGGPVTLTVCNLNVTVPGVLASDDTSARNAITAAGLTVGTVTMVANCNASHGTVLTQNPDGGTVVVRGSSVSLRESTGLQPNGKPCVLT